MIKGDGDYRASDSCLESLLQRVIRDHRGQFPSLRKPSTFPFSSPHFAERLAHLVDVFGWTLEELADATQLPEATLAAYHQGTAHPSVTEIELIADALMVSPAWLGFGVGPVILELPL